MEALVHHQRAAPCGHETVIVVADRPDIEGSARAERLGIPNVIEPVAGSAGGTRAPSGTTSDRRQRRSHRLLRMDASAHPSLRGPMGTEDPQHPSIPSS